MSDEYIITFGVEVSPEKGKFMEKAFGIPVCSGSECIQADSPLEAINMFRRKHGIRYHMVPTTDVLKSVYIVRKPGESDYHGYRLAGLKWNADFTTLIPAYSLFGR